MKPETILYSIFLFIEIIILNLFTYYSYKLFIKKVFLVFYLSSQIILFGIEIFFLFKNLNDNYIFENNCCYLINLFIIMIYIYCLYRTRKSLNTTKFYDRYDLL
jgi:hypothetical protein